MKKEDKKSVSIVVCGHVDSGKSTTAGRLIYELGGLSSRELEKLKKEAEAIGKSTFHFAFSFDRSKESRERGVTISCSTKEFFTETKHYTIIDAPGHKDFIKNMISGSSQADVALLMVPADGNFVSAISKANQKAGVIQGQTRQHALLINLLGVKQLIVGINKMDSAKFSEDRFREIREEMERMLKVVGWKATTVANCVTFLPIAGLSGDNLLECSENMPWWKGQLVKRTDGETVMVKTLYDALDKAILPPVRNTDCPLVMPVSQVIKIPGVGDVLTGRIEQGVLKKGDEVKFVPGGATGKVFSIENHHKQCDQAIAGDQVGVCIRKLSASPKTGNVMTTIDNNTISSVSSFVCQVQVSRECDFFPLSFMFFQRFWLIHQKSERDTLPSPLSRLAVVQLGLTLSTGRFQKRPEETRQSFQPI